MTESAKIVVFCVGCAIAYGIVHDQFTAHLCVDYFSVAHPRVISSNSPFLLALVWGVLATWWVGFSLGVLLAFAAQAGVQPKVSLSEIRPIVYRLLLFMAACATLAGTAAWLLASRSLVTLPSYWANALPVEKHVPFLADAWAHLASYASGALGGLAVVAYVLVKRYRLRT
jgi:hypothetical protein